MYLLHLLSILSAFDHLFEVLENDLKKEKDWRSQLQASKESADDNVSQLSKELLFYKKVADVSSANLAYKKNNTGLLHFSFYLKSLRNMI